MALGVAVGVAPVAVWLGGAVAVEVEAAVGVEVEITVAV
jgi:hypothetical protein